MPGALIAMGRLNRPALMVYGGTIRPGVSKLTGDNLNIVDAFQSFGAFSAGKISEEERSDQVRHACPGAGACGGMYTANTMASAIEALGMCLPFSSSIPAEDSLKMDECRCGVCSCWNVDLRFESTLEGTVIRESLTTTCSGRQMQQASGGLKPQLMVPSLSCCRIALSSFNLCIPSGHFIPLNGPGSTGKDHLKSISVCYCALLGSVTLTVCSQGFP
jgi:hypothetical protein